jgi:23S rRNA (cytidine1920-2'-O)/16S rRNA (cytidine1409-2'-O)-methyltransferase
VLLVKPQFEAGREKIEKGGLAKNPKVHEGVLLGLCQFFQDEGLTVKGITYSPITGADGNIEFFVYMKKGGEPRMKIGEFKRIISEIVETAHRELR